MSYTAFGMTSANMDKLIKVFPDKKYNLIYNKAKIRQDPLNFRLASRVIPYEFEVDTYRPNQDTLIDMLNKVSFDFNGIQSMWHLGIDDYISIKCDIQSHSLRKKYEILPSSFCKDENLRFYLDVASLRVQHFESAAYPPSKTLIPMLTYYFERLSNVVVYLSSEKSIVTELFLNNFAWKNRDFKALREIKDIQDEINTKSVIDIIFSSDAWIWTPLDLSTKKTLACPTGIPSPINRYPITNANDIEFCKAELSRSYALGLEIMYFLYNNDKGLYDEIFNESSVRFRDLVEVCRVKGVFDETDLETRFKEISLAIDALDLTEIEKMYSNNEIYVDERLHDLIAFANNYAVRNTYLKIELLLIKYAKANGISLISIIDAENSAMPTGMDLTGDTESTKTPKTYMHYDTLTEAKEDPSKKKSKALGIDPAILDKAITEFSADKYDFKIESKYTSKVNQDVVDNYNAVANASKMITNNLIKQIKDIKCYNFGGKNSGKWNGKLDNKRLFLYKTQKNIFCDNTYKVKEMDPVFGIVLDQSGSMSGSGIENGRTTMILLHEVLKSLGVNHSIIGHTSTDFHQATIFKYVAFKEDKGYTLNKAYNLATMKAYNGNCDSGALYYMEQQLLRTKQKDKICVIFSDGEPTECDDDELIEQVRNMEAHGIRVIGIGVDFESIREYYPNYANGRNLKEMLDIVCKILKQYVLEKED